MNYARISEAIEFYKSLEYTWIDTPWIVSNEASALTFAGLREKCELGYLVGSAEQGFIQLLLDKKISSGRYVSAGPCFRFDDNGQPGKHPYFFKVELISIAVPEDNVFWVMNDARRFLGGDEVIVNGGYDLELNGIEIGSYGHRSVRGILPWIYGTGLAEPRYTEALSRV